MSASDSHFRYEELSAGHALGDLSPEEVREWIALGDELGMESDLGLELLVACMETQELAANAGPLPAALAAKLHANARDWARPAADPILRPQVSSWQRVLRSPLTGWAAAAVVLLVSIFSRDGQVSPLAPDQAEARLREVAPDLVEHAFTGLGPYSDTSGKVIWSDQFQQGYMTLTGIPANDPAKEQYQLWIVDPTRDEAPVDGGVFDIPSNGSPVVVPISAKLALKKPQAFVITLEQPGGVVKSKQEKVVALAKG
jgi:hypothetical protein